MDSRPLLRIRVQRDDFDVAAEIDAVSRGRRDVGAVVSFTGLCRDENGRLDGLELEHYPAMAERELQRLADEAAARWPLTAVTILHRHGRIEAGERIVLVVTASAHRQAAFEAASFLMDYLKTRAPFWKKELGRQETRWVEARAEDSKAAQRWR
jgi:molybdopterin synthase catalytic subunit